MSTLAQRSPLGHLGRTSLMKYFYFLQTLRQVPLGYRFTLYSYGPFDSDVLADLGTGESLNVLETTPIVYSGGYGYQIRPGSRTQWVQTRAEHFLRRHSGDVGWLFDTFGGLNSGELELVSTIVFVDREAHRLMQHLTIDEFGTRVHEIKPHFSEGQVQAYARRLLTDGLLVSLLEREPRALR
jgi:hypothetical protein